MCVLCVLFCFVFQAEDGIRDLVRSRGLGDVYKRQHHRHPSAPWSALPALAAAAGDPWEGGYWSRALEPVSYTHLTLPTRRSSVDLGGRRIIKQKKEARVVV